MCKHVELLIALGTALPSLSLDEAHDLAKETDYADAAAEQESNPINWGDADAFFIEGYNHAYKQLKKVVKEWRAKYPTPDLEARKICSGCLGASVSHTCDLESYEDKLARYTAECGDGDSCPI